MSKNNSIPIPTHIRVGLFTVAWMLYLITYVVINTVTGYHSTIAATICFGWYSWKLYPYLLVRWVFSKPTFPHPLTKKQINSVMNAIRKEI